MSPAKKIVVVTSGGDAPGMNAAIRAVTRAACSRGWEAFGSRHGFEGLIKGDLRPLGPREVGGIMQTGGTILGSARSKRFKEAEGQLEAVAQLERLGVSAAVVIGGNGSQQGAYALSRAGLPTVGVASTIDNDLVGSDVTIGVDTALNVALEAIDRLKSTGSSLGRAFLLEVMGRDCGYLALMAAVAGGAEAVVIPEVETDPDKLAAEIRAAYERGKPHGIVVVAEGSRYNAASLAHHFTEHKEVGFDVRVTILGHVQRGARPTYADRMLATRLGAAAVDHLGTGRHGVLVGMLRGEVAATPLAEVAGKTKPLDLALLELAGMMAL
ncbi:MAG: 6-phosphofructokinase [Elusimicrobia bacterium]|nr:6-phosphofructokinase [Elusimicrobiota bacterium]